MSSCDHKCGNCANWYSLPEYVIGTKHAGYCIHRHDRMLYDVIRYGRPSLYDIEYALQLEDTTADETNCGAWEARYAVA